MFLLLSTLAFSAVPRNLPEITDSRIPILTNSNIRSESDLQNTLWCASSDSGANEGFSILACPAGLKRLFEVVNGMLASSGSITGSNYHVFGLFSLKLSVFLTGGGGNGSFRYVDTRVETGSFNLRAHEDFSQSEEPEIHELEGYCSQYQNEFVLTQFTFGCGQRVVASGTNGLVPPVKWNSAFKGSVTLGIPTLDNDGEAISCSNEAGGVVPLAALGQPLSFFCRGVIVASRGILERKNEELVRENLRLQNEKGELQQQLTLAKQQLQQLKQQIDNLQADLKAASIEIDLLEQEVEILAKQTDDINPELQKLVDEAKSFKTEADALVEAVDKTSTAILTTQTQLEFLQSPNKVNIDTTFDLMKQSNDIEDRSRNLLTKIARLAGALARYHQN